MSKPRVVITGIGAVSPLGFNKDQIWESLLERKISLVKESYPAAEGKWQDVWSHRVKKFDINKFGLDKDELDYIKQWKGGKDSKILNYLLAAVKVALDDSGIVYDKKDNNIGSFLTVEHPDFDSFCEELICDIAEKIESKKLIPEKEALLEHMYRANEKKGYDLHTFMHLYFVNKMFGFHGYSLFVNNACASGLYVLEAAARQIRGGHSQIALVAAGDEGGSIYKFRWFKDRGLYAADGLIKPFSREADGLVVGEGASVMVLEDYEHARRRGAFIYAGYLGGGFSCEGWKVIYPNVSEKNYHNCITQALAASGLSYKDIDLINPHGVGMKITDLYEARAVNDIFSASKKCRLSALKPYMGHNLGGSAVIESIVVILMLNHGMILPALNCNEPIKEIDQFLATDYIDKDINIAMKTSCGFAGYNAAAIFKKTACES
ncbi:MAG: beta-ketoacyl synthase N-terminal-like domain-containing protein [Candidatus Omnitrophota bacterium]